MKKDINMKFFFTINLNLIYKFQMGLFIIFITYQQTKGSQIFSLILFLLTGVKYNFPSSNSKMPWFRDTLLSTTWKKHSNLLKLFSTNASSVENQKMSIKQIYSIFQLLKYIKFYFSNEYFALEWFSDVREWKK